jgi:hypothetical protein
MQNKAINSKTSMDNKRSASNEMSVTPNQVTRLRGVIWRNYERFKKVRAGISSTLSPSVDMILNHSIALT